MKKVAILIMVISAIAFSITGCSNKEETTTTSATASNESISLVGSTTQDSELVPDNKSIDIISTNSTDEYPEEAGGNPNLSNATVLSITVSEDRYFVDNHEVSFDNLVEKVKALAEGSYVKLFDEKSTLKAFNQIKDYLDENGIMYEIE